VALGLQKGHAKVVVPWRVGHVLPHESAQSALDAFKRAVAGEIERPHVDFSIWCSRFGASWKLRVASLPILPPRVLSDTRNTETIGLSAQQNGRPLDTMPHFGFLIG
jgi:hypothetical protein